MPSLIRKILHYLVWGFLLYAVITDPERAAEIVRSVWDIISMVFVNVFHFFGRLLNGS